MWGRKASSEPREGAHVTIVKVNNKRQINLYLPKVYNKCSNEHVTYSFNFFFKLRVNEFLNHCTVTVFFD